MALRGLIEQRLRQQCLTGAGLRRAADVVEWMGAVQAQEYPAARWGLALRLTAAVADSIIATAVDRGEILRTHVLRPTWHFVTPADIRWMLALTGPRIKRAMAAYTRQQGLDAALIARAMAMIEAALNGRRSLTRRDLGAELARRGLTLKGTALALLTMHAEVDGIICSGPYYSRQLTYALLDERAPRRPGRQRALSGDEAVAELTRRYFQSHGPATLRDFGWWSGLPMAAGRRGLEIVGGRSRDVDGLTYWSVGPARPRQRNTANVFLLPIYDEYTVAYRDRQAVPHGARPPMRTAAGEPVIVQHALVIDGQVAGTWRTAGHASGVVTVTPARRLTAEERDGVDAATMRYRQFHVS